MTEGKTLTNALIGAVVTVFATPIVPFAPVLGGGVSGYLEGGDSAAGLKVGTIAGILALLPLLFILFVLGNLFLVFVAASGQTIPTFVGGLSAIIVLFIVISGFVYVVLLSAIGGWAGNYIQSETDY